ncbi:MAG: hypothetical protein ACK5NC_11280 [Vibrio sp.]
MAILKCTECLAKVSSEAEACPKCGAPAPKSRKGISITEKDAAKMSKNERKAFVANGGKITIPKSRKVITLSIIGAIIIFLGVSGNNYKNMTPEEKAERAQKQVNAQKIRDAKGDPVKMRLLECDGIDAWGNNKPHDWVAPTKESCAAFIKDLNEKRTNELLAKAKELPASKFRENADVYEELSELHPDNKQFSDKAKSYKEKADRQSMISEHFSRYSGDYIPLAAFIQQRMNDPDSYEHVNTVYWDKGDHLIVETTFRGKNKFGAKAISTITAQATLDGNITKIISQK